MPPAAPPRIRPMYNIPVKVNTREYFDKQDKLLDVYWDQRRQLWVASQRRTARTKRWGPISVRNDPSKSLRRELPIRRQDWRMNPPWPFQCYLISRTRRSPRSWRVEALWHSEFAAIVVEPVTTIPENFQGWRHPTRLWIKGKRKLLLIDGWSFNKTLN